MGFDLNPIKLGNESVEVVQEYTYLGFVLDEHLTFSNHISYLIRSSVAKVYTLAKIRRFIDCDTAVTVFKSFILPKLEYGDVFCCGGTKKLLSRLQVVMNKALRICFRSKRDDSNYFNHLKGKVLPLYLRRKCSILRLMHPIASRSVKEGGREQMPSSQRVTRMSKFPRLTCAFPNSESFRKSISYVGPKYWERLPGRLKVISDLNSFKQAIKTHYRDLFIEDGFV